MAFRVKRKESLAEAVRRLGCKSIRKAIAGLKKCPRAEGIHSARKEIKRARAILKFAHAGLSNKDYCRQNRLLRQAARKLAPPRDTFVMVKTFTELASRFKKQLELEAFDKVCSDLQTELGEEMQGFARKRKPKKVAKLLHRVEKRFRWLEVGGKGWKAICRGLKNAFTDGGRAYQKVLKDCTAKDFHEWRKRTKELWHEITLLQPICPEQMESKARDLKKLGETLGDDHDLVILRESLQQQYADDASVRKDFNLLDKLINKRQRELRRTAVLIGERIYQEKPSAFYERLGEYWRAWKRGE